jgi:hypothetical protein
MALYSFTKTFSKLFNTVILHDTLTWSKFSSVREIHLIEFRHSQTLLQSFCCFISCACLASCSCLCLDLVATITEEHLYTNLILLRSAEFLAAWLQWNFKFVLILNIRWKDKIMQENYTNSETKFKKTESESKLGTDYYIGCSKN